MALTQQHRQFIVEQIVYDINEAQASDYYEFGDLSITWISEQESYLVEQNGETDWASPRCIESYIDDLSDQQLVEWFVDKHGLEDSLEKCLELQGFEEAA